MVLPCARVIPNVTRLEREEKLARLQLWLSNNLQESHRNVFVSTGQGAFRDFGKEASPSPNNDTMAFVSSNYGTGQAEPDDQKFSPALGREKERFCVQVLASGDGLFNCSHLPRDEVGRNRVAEPRDEAGSTYRVRCVVPVPAQADRRTVRIGFHAQTS